MRLYILSTFPGETDHIITNPIMCEAEFSRQMPSRSSLAKTEWDDVAYGPHGDSERSARKRYVLRRASRDPKSGLFHSVPGRSNLPASAESRLVKAEPNPVNPNIYGVVPPTQFLSTDASTR